jgi:hypothetical protein
VSVPTPDTGAPWLPVASGSAVTVGGMTDEVTPGVPGEVRRAAERVRRAMEAAGDTEDPRRYLHGVAAAAQELVDTAVFAGVLSLGPVAECPGCACCRAGSCRVGGYCPTGTAGGGPVCPCTAG